MWNLLQDELGGGVWPRLLVALVDTGAKGLILMAAAGLAAAALRRNAAAARHLVWILALCGLLILPVVSLMMPKWTLPILPATEAPAVAPIAPTPPIATAPAAPAVVSKPMTEIAPVAPNVIPPTARSERPPAPIDATPPESAQAPMNYSAWLLATWLAFALLSLAPFAAGLVAVARMRRRAQAFSEGDLQALASALGQCIGLKRPARLLRGPAASMPMATGFIKPAVFLPDDALAWTEEKRRVVLLHELAHVKRRDCLTHAIARTATALHWFNPLAWIALRQLRIEREHACDDLVLAAGERPSAYAENLLEIARTLRADTITAAAAITMAQKSQLEGRLLAVLDGARNRSRVTKRLVAASILGTIFLLALVSSVDVARSDGAEGIGATRDNAVPIPQNERSDGDFSVEFPGGYRARVVGVGDSNGKPSETFWVADGAPLETAPEGFQGEQSFVTPSSESVGRMFFVEVLPPPENPTLGDVAFKCQIESPGSSGSQSGSGAESFIRNTLGATWPANITKASIKVGLATGPWTTVIRSCLGCIAGNSEYNVIFSDAFVREGENRVIATHGHFDKDYRVVAVDASDIVYTLDRSGAGETGGMSQSEWILADIAPENVKALEIQTRSYEWKTIGGIALYPAGKPAQSNAEQSSAYASESPYSVFNHDHFSTLLEDPNLLTHISGDAITPPAADTSWGPVVNGLQAAVRFKPEKPEYLVGEKIDMEFLVRNTGPEPLEFLTSETRLFQLYLSRKILTSISVNSDMGKIRRVKLAPGEVASIDGMCNSVMQNSTRQETEESIGTYEQSHPNIYEIRFDLNFPDAYSNSGEFAPRPGDWTGTLTTGKRNLNLVKKLAPDVATDTRGTINIFTDSRDEIESNKPQPVVPAFRDPFALNPRDRFLRTPAADTVWGEVNYGLQASLQFTPERANYVLGEAIPFEFLVRNVGNAPVRFVIREYLQYGEPKVLDGSGNSILAESISNTAWPSLVRIQLDPGQCVGLPGEGLAFLPKDQNAASRLNYYVGTYFESEAGMYNIQYSFNLPGGSSTTGEFAPQPGDWTGTLTTGMRTISIVESRDPNNPSPLLQVRWLASESGAAKATAMPWRSGSKPTNEPDQLWLLDEVLFTEKDIVGVQALPDQAREHFLVEMQLNDEATTRWEKLTQENLKRKMAIVSRGQVLAAPIVNGTIGDGTLTISGNFSEAEANSFADEVRADHPGMADSFTLPDNAAPTLGPEVEVTIRHSGENCMIDFDSGKLFTPPDFDGTEDAFAWCAKNGIDAGGGNQPEVRGLIGMDLVLNPEANTIWDNAATNDALKHDAFKYGKPGNPVYLSAKGDLPATWTIKTREGGLGIVQILGFEDEEPRGVKIRYRMLETNSQ